MNPLRQGSHLIPLADCLAATSGPVLEIGVGNYSTPYLTKFCLETERELASVEDQEFWVDQFPDSTLVDYDISLPLLACKEWSIVLIDHWPPTRRSKDALLFKKSATYVLIHDWPKMMYKESGDSSILSHWEKYRIDYNTLVLWGNRNA